MNKELAEEIANADNAIQFAWEWNMGYKQNFCCDYLLHGCIPDDWEDATELDYSSAMENYVDDIRQYIVGSSIGGGEIFNEEDIAKIYKFVINPQETCVLALINW